MPEPAMRLQRALARGGVASRRAAERLIADGRVTVNGEIGHIGQSVAEGDEIAVDGRPVHPEAPRAFLLHKARGSISTARDPQGRPTVLDGLPGDRRLYPVGRLDRETTGALVITNDGELAHRLMHPSRRVAKVYEALLRGEVDERTIRALGDGVDLDDGRTAPARAARLARRDRRGTWVRIVLHEGRNRQVRRMGEAVGHPVLALHRAEYAGLTLGGLAPGEWRELDDAERERLRAAGEAA